MQENPSRLLVKFVKGNPSEKIKAMFGVYKITARKGWQYMNVPVFTHSTQNDQRFFFSYGHNLWKFQKGFETIMSWKKEQNVFSDEFWSKPNGSAVINFDSPKFTINLISY